MLWRVWRAVKCKSPAVTGSLFPASVLEPLFFAISGFALLAFGVGVALRVRELREAVRAPCLPHGGAGKFQEIKMGVHGRTYG